ncbi:MAG: hypothetical protein OMM_13521 [Candidatus Magnetoglobus multicellularis str. Araruama]|uniref:Uncharacterized protein n=1 Tax=Candidatus Magnetoglobus multicellularis str. Araruama TaxID=890399 RepID=A0A1V1NTM0_9BACT|nr:MAG: hypothetical protein OMM_13521 [Candidatus Magnetoglobus multicellularis str. Araruama]
MIANHAVSNLDSAIIEPERMTEIQAKLWTTMLQFIILWQNQQISFYRHKKFSPIRRALANLTKHNMINVISPNDAPYLIPSSPNGLVISHSVFARIQNNHSQIDFTNREKLQLFIMQTIQQGIFFIYRKG